MRSSNLSNKYPFDLSIPFSKYSGCGNDFILIDNRTHIFPSKDVALISRLCHRRFGVGADGVVLVESSHKAAYKMRIFNADGNEAEMCGNGLRCLGRFLEEQNLATFTPTQALLIETVNQIYSLFLHEDSTVSIKMPPPSEVEWDIAIPLGDKEWRLDYLNTGVPHVILCVDEISDYDLTHLGPLLRNHPRFSPHGTNVNLLSRKPNSTTELLIRTYERGVEGETLACGTGGAACALVAWKKYGGFASFRVHFISGEQVDYQIECDEETLESISMRGPATFVFKGVV